MRPLRAAVLTGAGIGAYSFVEPYRVRLAERRVEVSSGCPPLTVLHLSDTHMSRRTTFLERWTRSLPERLRVTPDVVLATGDLIDDDAGISGVLRALEPIEAHLGLYYVLGSHDYFVSSPQGYGKYLGLGPSQGPPVRRNRVHDLEAGLRELGWTPLTNRTELIDTRWGRVRLAGVDDPYIARHSTSHIERSRDDAAAIGVVHAPDVVSEWALNGFDLVVAGHTHGGQVRVPGVGALVTNCRLPNALAHGLHRVGGTWLHVSPGLGHGRHAPIRFACRPEATLLSLTPTEERVADEASSSRSSQVSSVAAPDVSSHLARGMGPTWQIAPTTLSVRARGERRL